jgi:hypothetical protein
MILSPQNTGPPLSPGQEICRCGRLHGRLVAQPPARDDAGLLTDLRTLVPALSGLLGTLAQTLPKGQVA